MSFTESWKNGQVSNVQNKVPNEGHQHGRVDSKQLERSRRVEREQNLRVEWLKKREDGEQNCRRGSSTKREASAPQEGIPKWVPSLEIGLERWHALPEPWRRSFLEGAWASGKW
jgi:hypothetical protein